MFHAAHFCLSCNLAAGSYHVSIEHFLHSIKYIQYLTKAAKKSILVELGWSQICLHWCLMGLDVSQSSFLLLLFELEFFNSRCFCALGPKCCLSLPLLQPVSKPEKPKTPGSVRGRYVISFGAFLNMVAGFAFCAAEKHALLMFLYVFFFLFLLMFHYVFFRSGIMLRQWFFLRSPVGSAQMCPCVTLFSHLHRQRRE